MWLFFLISALKILVIATAMPAIFDLILKKNSSHCNLTIYLESALWEKNNQNNINVN
jgi:hypothetical protein